MTLFSIIVPTRERLESVRDLLTSLEKTTYDLNSIEVFLVCDADDQIMLQAIKPLQEQYKLPLRFVIRRRRTKQWVDVYFNKTVPLTKGQYIVPLSDDMQFMTDHWDKIFLRKLEDYLADKPDGIVYGRTSGGMKEWNRRRYFWHGKKRLRFEMDLTKNPPIVKPYTDKINLKRDGTKQLLTANPIIQEGEEYKLTMVYIEDKTKLIIIYGKKEQVPMSCSPFISRKAIDVLGHLFHSYIGAQGADFAIAKIYQDVDRILDLPEIEIRHFHKHDNKVHENLKKMSDSSNWFTIADLITKDVEKLNKHIELCKKINKVIE